MRKTLFRNPIFIFSVIYAILALGLCLAAAVFGRSLVQAWDAFDQHYPFMLYLSRFYRNFIAGIFQGNVSVPTWDLTLGMGQGIVATLYHYGIADPFNFPLVFLPASAVLYYYSFLLLLRPYLAGLAFLLFCKHKGHQNLFTLLGAFLYILSGFGLYAMSVHPFFMNAMIGLPMALMGFDLLCEKKKPVLWTLTIFVLACQGFYFTYMITLMVIVYAIVCAICPDEIGIRPPFANTLRKWLIASGYYLLGLCMAMFVFLPGVMAFLQSGRGLSQSEASLWMYTPDTLLAKLKHFFIITYDDDVVATSVLIIPAIIWLWKHRKSNLRLLVPIILGILSIFIPMIAFVFNGFSLYSRHVFGLIFILSYAIVCALPHLQQLFRKPPKYVTRVATIVVVASLLLNLALDAPTLLRTLRVGDPYQEFEGSALADAAQSIPDRLETDRFEADAKDCYFYNIGAALEVPTTRVYASIVPQSFVSSFGVFENSNALMLQKVYGLDSRTALEALSGVTYFATDEDSCRVPYGFGYTHTTSHGTQVYQNPYALGLGYVYTTKLSNDAWNSMDGIQKSDALLQGIYSEHAFEGLAEIVPTNHETFVTDMEIQESSNISFQDNQVKVTEAGATLTIYFNGMPNSETYLTLSGVRTDAPVRGQILTQSGEFLLLSFLAATDIYYSGQTTFTYNLGYAKAGQSKVTLSFDAPCEFSLDDLQIHCLSMEDYVPEITALGESKLTNIQKTPTGLTGEIDVKKSSALCLAIPYMKGYTVRIDGEIVPYERVNVAYTGVSISEGQHIIEVSYEAPGAKIGLILSGIGLLMFLFIIIKRRLSLLPQK